MELKFETQAIRSQMKGTSYREHSSPMFVTSSFTFDSTQHGADLFNGATEGNLYSRFSNPNTEEFAHKMALLEQAEAGIATASGMAAVFGALMPHLKSGDHIVASSAIFGNTLRIVTHILPNYGISYTLVNVDNTSAWEQAIKKNTKAIFVESPANPTLKIADLSFLGNLCRTNNILFCVDNCFATPYLQKPILFGADLVVHSATKYIDGQGRVLGGAIVGAKKYVDKCYEFLRRTGASLSPFNAWVLSKSLETLALRMDRHCYNATEIYNYLKSNPEVTKVYYPFGEANPQLPLAKKQMLAGGGLVGCELKEGRKRAERFLNALKIHSLTANLGDSRSIATHPASTTHSKLSPAQLHDAGITTGYIRFSVGLEHSSDLIIDIDQAIENSK